MSRNISVPRASVVITFRSYYNELPAMMEHRGNEWQWLVNELSLVSPSSSHTCAPSPDVSCQPRERIKARYASESEDQSKWLLSRTVSFLDVSRENFFHPCRFCRWYSRHPIRYEKGDEKGTNIYEFFFCALKDYWQRLLLFVII